MNKRESALRVVQELKAKCPASISIQETQGEDLELGLLTDFEFIPQNLESASLEITVTDDGACMWSIDRHARLATRLGLKKGNCKIDFVGIGGYDGPVFLELDELRQVYDAVYKGQIQITVGIAFNKLVGTKCKYVSLGNRKHKVFGVGDVWMAKLASLIGRGKVRMLNYAPWQ